MLELKNITKTFKIDDNPQNDRKALKGINLTLENGDFVTVIGGNGSGKSTLFNTIAGAVGVDTGSIILKDLSVKKKIRKKVVEKEITEKTSIDITKLKEYKRAKYIGRVFQDPMIGTIPSMSLFENLALAQKRGKRNGFRWSLSNKKKEGFKEMLTPLGLNLETRLNAKIGLFSGGERQAITLLMATLNKPEILLLDEHTAALDPKTAKLIMKLTDKMVRELQVPTIMITHNMKDAIKYGNRLVMMAEGKIIFEASGKEKEKLTVEELINKFSKLSKSNLSDSMVL